MTLLPHLPRPSFKTRGELWLARGLRRFYGLWPRRLEACPPPAFALHAIAPAPGAQVPAVDGAAPRPIPRVIWAYWKGAAPPLLIQRCFANWRRSSPGYEIRLLDDVSAREWLQEIPSVLDHVSPAKRADWIRLELLRLHGGIWVDASSILTAPLDWVLEQQARTPATSWASTWNATRATPPIRWWRTGSWPRPGQPLHRRPAARIHHPGHPPHGA